LIIVSELARDRLIIQMGQIDALDAKISGIFGFASAIAAVAAAFLGLRAQSLNSSIWGLLGLGLAMYVYVLIQSLRISFPGGWHVGPDLHDLWARLESGTDTPVLWHLIAYSLTEAHDFNRPRIEAKARVARHLMIALAAEALCFIGAITLMLISSSV